MKAIFCTSDSIFPKAAPEKEPTDIAPTDTTSTDTPGIDADKLDATADAPTDAEVIATESTKPSKSKPKAARVIDEELLSSIVGNSKADDCDVIVLINNTGDKALDLSAANIIRNRLTTGGSLAKLVVRSSVALPGKAFACVDTITGDLVFRVPRPTDAVIMQSIGLSRNKDVKEFKNLGVI